MGSRSSRRRGKKQASPQEQQSEAELPEGILQQTEIQAKGFSGPVPHPDVLERYEDIVTGAADRIIALAEREAAHRHEMEHKAIEVQAADMRADRVERRIGQIFALTIGLAAFITCATLVLKGHSWPGGILGTTGVVGLVAVFVYGRRAGRPSSDQKDR